MPQSAVDQRRTALGEERATLREQMVRYCNQLDRIAKQGAHVDRFASSLQAQEAVILARLLGLPDIDRGAR